jgi:hypothetical protein
MLQQQINFLIAYFDGVAQQDGLYCGAGGVMKFPDQSITMELHSN